MEEFPLEIIAQVPIVGIFVYFVLKNNQEWRKYLTERNGRSEVAMGKMVETLGKMREAIETHAVKEIEVFAKLTKRR